MAGLIREEAGWCAGAPSRHEKAAIVVMGEEKEAVCLLSTRAAGSETVPARGRE